MDTYALQRLIIEANLAPTEQHVALVFAMFYNRKKKCVHVSQAKVAEICGYSERTIRRAVAALVDKGIFKLSRTRRVATMFPAGKGKEVGNMERTPMSYGDRTPVSYRGGFALDTEYSTGAEERHK